MLSSKAREPSAHSDVCQVITSFSFVMPGLPSSQGNEKLFSMAKALNDSLGYLKTGNGTLFRFIKSMVHFILESRKATPIEKQDLQDFLQSVESCWATFVASCSPQLSEADLLAIGISSLPSYGKDYLPTLLQRYLQPSFETHVQIYLSVPVEEDCFDDHYDEILSYLNSSVLVTRCDALPKPSKWPAGLLLTLSVPKEDVPLVELAILHKQWEKCVPYFSIVQDQPWCMQKPEFSLHNRKRWDVQIMDEEKKEPSGLDLVRLTPASKEVAEVIHGDLAFMNQALLMLSQDIESKSGRYGQVLRQQDPSRNWFAVKFNHDKNLLCISSRGKGGGMAILFEKNDDGLIDPLLVKIPRYSTLAYEDFLSIPLSSFCMTTHVPVFYSAEMQKWLPQIHLVRDVISRAILGGFAPEKSLIAEIERVTGQSPSRPSRPLRRALPPTVPSAIASAPTVKAFEDKKNVSSALVLYAPRGLGVFGGSQSKTTDESASQLKQTKPKGSNFE